MAYTQEQIDELAASINLMPQSTRSLLNDKSTTETLEAVGIIISAQRRQGMANAVGQIVTGAVVDWGALRAAGQYADGAATIASLQAFADALDAGASADELAAAAIATCFAARKHFGV